MTSSLDDLKKIAAEKAVEQVHSGMLIGLGVGSTAIHAVNKIGELISSRELTNIEAIACSLETEVLASDLGIPLSSLQQGQLIDITIDGADEVDKDLNLIKGGGGALLREKIVAQSTKHQIIVVDDSKLSENLGEKFHLPVEVIPFSWESHVDFLIDLGGMPALRMIDNETPYQTDQGNYIIDCDFGIIKEPKLIATQLDKRAGIIEHGLFLGLANEIIVASSDGIEILK